MKSEIKLFFQNITEKTGIEFAVFSNAGEPLFGDYKSGETLSNEFEGVFSDIGLNRTCFRIKILNEEFLGRIIGAGKQERNYAYLISELAEKSFVRVQTLSKEEFYRALLFGEIEDLQFAKYSRQYSIPSGSCCVMVVNCPQKSYFDIVNVFSAYNEEDNDFIVKLSVTSFAFIKFYDFSVEEYHSFTEYARFLLRSVYEETGVNISVFTGTQVNSVKDLSLSFTQAVLAEKMGTTEDKNGKVNSFKKYIFQKILEELPKQKLKEYKDMLFDDGVKEIFSDEEMVATAEEFLNNDLNQSQTARKLFLHRNTLNYRLDKIQKCTGLDIRNFSDAVTFRIITLLNKLVKNV